MRTVHLLILPLLLVSLSGCVISVNGDFDSDSNDWESRQMRNAQAIKQLNLSRSQQSIETELGEADFTEKFVRQGAEFTVLYYRTQRTRDDGKTTRDETTPLVFVDNVLVGWGDSAVLYATAP